MPFSPIKHAAPSLQGKSPEELPHGLIAPPAEVRALLERERTQHPAEVFAKAELGVLNLWTISYYFDGLGQEVLYRETPQGPEVLAVGSDEVLALRQQIGLDERRDLKTYLGY
jgi:hypothetical protein